MTEDEAIRVTRMSSARPQSGASTSRFSTQQRAQSSQGSGRVLQTRACNYRGPRRRPVSATVPRRVNWEPGEDEELKFEAHLVATQQAAAPTPRQRTATLRRYRCRDLLSSHARRVDKAEGLGRADSREASIARKVIEWQVKERERQTKQQREKCESSALQSTKSSNGFVSYRPQTADEWVMNNLWQKRRQEELVNTRNSLQVDQALNEWQSNKNRLEEEIQRRIETRRRPFTEQADKTYRFGTTIKEMFPPVERHQEQFDEFEALSIDTESSEEKEQEEKEEDEGKELPHEEQETTKTRKDRPQTPQARGDALELDVQTGRAGTAEHSMQRSSRRRSKQASARDSKLGSKARQRLTSPIVIPRTDQSKQSSRKDDTSRSLQRPQSTTLRMLGSRAETRDRQPSTDGLVNRKTWYTADDEVPATAYEDNRLYDKITEWSEAAQEQSVREAEASYLSLKKANITNIDPNALRRALVLDTVAVAEEEEEKKEEVTDATAGESKEIQKKGKQQETQKAAESENIRPRTAPSYMTTFGYASPGLFLPKNPFLEEKLAIYAPPAKKKGGKKKKKKK